MINRNGIDSKIIKENQNWSFGDGLKFDGANDYVAIPIQSYGATSLSIIGFAKFGTLSNDGAIIGQGLYSVNLGGYFSVIARTDFSLSYTVAYGNNYATIRTLANTIQSNVPFHFACVFDFSAKTTKIYLNGTLQTVTTSTGGTGLNGVISLTPTNTAGRYQTIGLYDDERPTLLLYKDYIFDLKIFNKALTQAEITEMYLKSNQIVPSTAISNLLQNYEFNQRQNYTLLDSVSAINGTLTNYTAGDVTVGVNNKWVYSNGNPITAL